MSKRKMTVPDAAPDWSLSQQHQTAIDLIVAGRNLQETADAIGVQRPTVSHWLNHHCGFQAALNRRREELWADLTDGLRALAPTALEVLKRELEGATPLPAALAILKAVGLTSANLRPTGPTTVEAVLAEQRQREMERTATAITEADVAQAQRRREQDRTMAELLL